MVFIESSSFTLEVRELLSDESYAALQRHLIVYPEAGAVIQDTGGLRKIRWSARCRGKRGGTRVIYFHVANRHQIRLLLIYRKGIKDDLSPGERKILRALNDSW